MRKTELATFVVTLIAMIIIIVCIITSIIHHNYWDCSAWVCALIWNMLYFSKLKTTND